MLIRDCWIKCRSKTYIAFEGIRLKGSEKIARARSGECSFSSTIRTNSHIGMICFNLITHRSAFYGSNNINKCWWITNNSHKRQPSSSWSRRRKCANIFSLHNTHNPSRMHLDFRLLYQDCAHGSPAWFILIRYSNGKRKKATMPLWWLHHFDFRTDDGCTRWWRWLHQLRGYLFYTKQKKKSCPHIWLAKFKNSSNTEIFDSTKPVTCIEQSS